MDFIGHDYSTEKTASYALNTEEIRKASTSLEKLASLPYKQDAYDATRGIMKIASDMLSEAANIIESSRKRVDELEKFAEIHSIIDEMIERGLINKGEERDKIAELLKKENLDVVKQAMTMINGTHGNIFFELDDVDDKSSGHEKRGMFDGIINI